MNKPAVVMVALAAGVAEVAREEAKELAALARPVVTGPVGPVPPSLSVLLVAKARLADRELVRAMAGAKELALAQVMASKAVQARANRGFPVFTTGRARSTRRSSTRSRNT